MLTSQWLFVTKDTALVPVLGSLTTTDRMKSMKSLFDEVIIHIGMAKTGTTSLQKFLYQHESLLLEQRVGLLRSFSRPNNSEFAAFFQKNQNGAWFTHNGVHTKDEKARHFFDFEERFEAELERLSGLFGEARTKPRRLLITSEALHEGLETAKELSFLKQFLLKYFQEIKVIAYFRSSDSLIDSLYSQRLKTFETSGPDDFAKKMAFASKWNPRDAFELWSSVFGKESVDFIDIEKKWGKTFDVRRDFVGLLNTMEVGLPIDQFQFSENRANKGLNPSQRYLFMMTNRFFPFWCETHSRPILWNLLAKSIIVSQEVLFSPTKRKNFKSTTLIIGSRIFSQGNYQSRRQLEPDATLSISVEEAFAVLEVFARLGEDPVTQSSFIGEYLGKLRPYGVDYNASGLCRCSKPSQVDRP